MVRAFWLNAPMLHFEVEFAIYKFAIVGRLKLSPKASEKRSSR